MSDALNNKELFAKIVADLKPYVTATLYGFLSVARDPFEVIELLGEAPGRFRVILAWDGEDQAGISARSGVVNHKFRIVVSHNRGLSILRGENRTVARGEDKPLMELANLVRDRARSIALPNNETGRVLEYKGCEPIRAEFEGGRAGMLDAYELKFELKAAITRLAEGDYRLAA